MMNDTRRLAEVILIAVVAWFTLAPAAQAGYNYKKIVTVDRSRVAMSAVSPPGGFGYIKCITIDNTKVSGTSVLTDFPVLVSIQNDAALKTTANGGRVTDDQGDDIVFYAPDLSTVLDSDVEQYDGATGTLVAWVRLPALAYDVDTVFYLAYGNSGITSPQVLASDVWDSNYKGVWHLKEATDATNIDSTSNANHGTPQNSPAAAAGKIAGALDFEGANQTRVELGTASSLDMSLYSNWTISTWVKPSVNYTASKYPVLYTYGDWEVALDIAVQEGPEDGRIEYYLRDRLGLWSNTALNISAWNHVAVVHTPTTTYFYLNGVPDGSDNNDTIGADNSGSFIGGYPGYNDGDVMGLIDEVRVSDTNRSADWIATEYNNQNDPGGFMSIEDASPLADFPVLVSILNDEQLKTTANGGQVTDAEGDDIIFTTDADGLSPLNHEVESYDGTTGTLAAWVRLPSLTASEDTVFYMHYGNSAVSSPQGNAPAVWDASFRGVYHLVESGDGTVGEYKDSSGTGNHGRGGNGVASEAPAQTADGRIGNAQLFDGNKDWIYLGPVLPFPGSVSAATMSAWIRHDRLRTDIERYLDAGDDIAIRHDRGVGELDFFIRNAAATTLHIRVPVVLTDGTWYYVTGTWDGTNQRLYLNGQLVGSQVLAETLYLDGNARISSAEAMDGIIDEARISDTARSAAWIATEYNNQQWPNKAQYPVEGFITVQRAVCDIGASATPVTCGSTTAGSIETPGAWDAFELTLGADTWLDIYTTGTTDTYGHLYDGDCVEIAQNDTVDDNFFISQTVTAGTYYVQVRHASEFETGSYELHVECGDDDHGDNIDDATPLDCNSSIEGDIETGGDEDYFKVVFWGTGILTAYTTDGSDPNGTLLDDAGNFVAADDNSGGGNQFKIVQSVGPGVYYVVVREKDAASTGTYTLHVDCEYTPVITATSEYGGTISPAGAVGVTYDGSQSFTITPAAGNTVRDVWVDDKWIGAVSTYTFENVRTDHKIVAVFNADFENCIDIPDIPLDAWYRSAPANIMFVLDDSGSMDWEFMTSASDGLFDNYYRYVFDDPGDNLYGRVLSNDQRMKWQSQWAGYNKLYYDPASSYEPWPNHVAGDAAPTLPLADKDNPRSHPMDPDTTFNLNATYYQYASDTQAIIVNDQDSGFSKTPEAAGDETLLSTGFEDAPTTWDDGFAGTGGWRADDKVTQGSYDGQQSAKADQKNGGYLTSDNLDASDLASGDSISVDLRFYKEKVQNDGELVLEYWDGAWQSNADFKPHLSADKTWVEYHHEIVDPDYFKSDFRIRFTASLEDKKGKFWLDDVVVKKNSGAGGWELATGSDQALGSDPDDPDGPGEYWWTGADADYTATWKANIPSDGGYDVYARWHAADNRSESVRYTVYHDTGSDFVDVNQRQNGGKWFKLGTFEFDKDDGATVTLSHTRNGDNDVACADAIKLVPAGAVDDVDIKRAHYYVWSESENKPYLVVLDGNIAYYAVNDADGDKKIEAGELALATTPPDDVKTGRTYLQERQNFANWYQFYRRRELAATAAVANVIVGLKGVHVGFYSINGNLVQPVLPVQSAGIDKSKKLLQALYGLKVRAQGTPLRRGLREVGKYFADSSDMIGNSPYAPADNGGACQQAFTILMTDGFWNGSNPKVGNSDGDDNTDFDGGGRADIYSDTLADVAMHYYENDLHTGLDDNIPTTYADTAAHQHMVTYSVSFGRVGSLNPDDYDIANGSFPVWPDPSFVGAHKIDDLWHAAVNGRGEFLNASSPGELVDSLLAISRSIQGRISSSSSVSVNGDPLYKELDADTHMYQATYRSDSWIGDVKSYQVSAADGEVADIPDWSAADRLARLDWDTDRIIATYDGSDGIPFRYDRSVLSIAQQKALGSDLVNNSPSEQNAAKILNYLRGDRSNESQNGGAFRERMQLLGDIVHSSPVYHQGVLYTGGNDGMLHAFDAVSGDERFAYVPKLVFGNLSRLVDPDYSHKYFVDLSPTVMDVTLGGQSKAILVGGLGKGGKGYFALDVSNPAAITDEDELSARVLWEFPDAQSEGQGYLAYDSRIGTISVGDIIFTNGKSAFAAVAGIPASDGNSGILDLLSVGGPLPFQDGEDLHIGADVKVAEVNGELYDPYMGYSYSRPVIAKSNDPGVDWLVIFGNGYNSAKGRAVLYILNLASGELVKRIDTGVGNCNGLSSPIAIDTDSNGTADYVYAGDLQGNLWKFDLSDSEVAHWEAAYEGTDGKPAPVFQAKNYSGHPQPITSKPDVMYHCSHPGYMVLFGTGMYLTEYDLETSESASIYGIWDYGDDDDDREYLGSFERSATPQLSNPHLTGVESRSRVKLLEQTVESGTWTTADGQVLRVITGKSPNWGTVADTDMGQTDPQPDPGSMTAGDTVHAGWFFDLPNAGERMVSDVVLRDGKVLVISFTPGDDPCGFGGDSIFHALDSCTGARTPFFVNINEVVHDSGAGGETIKDNSTQWKEISGVQFSGRLQPAVILRNGNIEHYYLSSSTGEVHKQNAAATKLGIFYWLQIE